MRQDEIHWIQRCAVNDVHADDHSTAPFQARPTMIRCDVFQPLYSAGTSTAPQHCWMIDDLPGQHTVSRAINNMFFIAVVLSHCLPNLNVYFRHCFLPFGPMYGLRSATLAWIVMDCCHVSVLLLCLDFAPFCWPRFTWLFFRSFLQAFDGCQAMLTNFFNSNERTMWERWVAMLSDSDVWW